MMQGFSLKRLMGAVASAAVVLGFGMGVPAKAQEAGPAYPSRPVRIVVGFPPGGPTDIVARALAQKMQEAWGQAVTVDNRPGATSNLAAEMVVRAEPDGHTLLLGTIANAINMAIDRTVRYDTLRDFAPISLLTASPSVLVVSPAFPAATLAELIAAARARPGALTYATTGTGGSPHLGAAMLEQRAGIQMVHVPYKGSAPALNDLVSGQVNLGFVTALSAVPLMQAGKLKPLAVASARPMSAFPEVKTFAELGFPGFEINSWNGMLAPRLTPKPVLSKIHAELVRIMTMPDIRERLAAQAAEPVASSPEAFAEYIRAEIRMWGEVARQARIQAD